MAVESLVAEEPKDPYERYRIDKLSWISRKDHSGVWYNLIRSLVTVSLQTQRPIALSKADLLPELDVHAFRDLVIGKSGSDVAQLSDAVSSMAQAPGSLWGRRFLTALLEIHAWRDRHDRAHRP